MISCGYVACGCVDEVRLRIFTIAHDYSATHALFIITKRLTIGHSSRSPTMTPLTFDIVAQVAIDPTFANLPEWCQATSAATTTSVARRRPLRPQQHGNSLRQSGRLHCRPLDLSLDRLRPGQGGDVQCLPSSGGPRRRARPRASTISSAACESASLTTASIIVHTVNASYKVPMTPLS